MTSLSVLVVDDEPTVCEFIKDYLSDHDFDVSLAHDAEQAKEVLREKKYHFVILDLKLPGVASGLDLVPIIHKVDHDIAVVILTGNPSPENAQASISHSVDGFLWKPLVGDKLLEELGRVAKKKGLCQGREEQLKDLISRRVRELRHERGLTLTQLSKRTSLSVSMISQIERGEVWVSVPSLHRLATAYGVPMADILGDF